ncbi:MAG TPA: DNA primase, partial [Candidatus Methylomirabilis sp.]|nr:DNA primase [Candidatus Methylomirabilis sp.]
MIPEAAIAEILRRTDIVELIGGHLPLKAAGRTHKALCPFHTEKTPSFIVNPERQIFHCFGCGEGGDAITFLMKHERLTFPEAARYLAERAGVPLPTMRSSGASETDGRLALVEVHRQALEHFRENLRGPEGSGAHDYLAGRGLTPALIDRFQLGCALPRWDALLRALKRRGHPDRLLEASGLIIARQDGSGHYDRFRNRLMIPIWDVSGKVVGFGGRALDASEVKYLNSPETALYRKGTHLFGLNLAARAIRERSRALVVEGYFDAITLHAHGFENAVATLGTALTTGQAGLLSRYARTLVLLFDPDAPGIGAARRILSAQGGLINVDLDWRIVLLPEGLDPDAYVRTHGTAAFAAVLEGAQDLVEFFLDRRVSGLDLTDPVQRARAVDTLVDVLATLDNPIRREGYIQRLAQRTGITDRTLL